MMGGGGYGDANEEEENLNKSQRSIMLYKCSSGGGYK